MQVVGARSLDLACLAGDRSRWLFTPRYRHPRGDLGADIAIPVLAQSSEDEWALVRCGEAS